MVDGFVVGQKVQKEQGMSISTEFDVEGCLAALDVEHGKLPEPALRWAQAHHEEMIPGLIRLVEEATAKALAGDVPETNGHFFAFCLLTEFQSREAWPALLAAMRLPGVLSTDLFGDLVHDNWKTTIRVLASDRVDDVLALIRDPEVYEYVRWSAVGGLVQMVAWELRTRDEVIGWLRALFLDACAASDLTLTAGIVCETCDLWPGELMEEFRSGYDRDLVDDSIIGWEDVEERHAAGLESTMKRLIERRLELTDTVTELSRWASFTERKPTFRELPASRPDPVYSPRPMSDPVPTGGRYAPGVGTIRFDAPRVGRNDPCSCGSGKKFKKCCGPASQAN